MENILVKLENYDQYLRIKPYDRKHGGKWGLLVNKDKLSKHINDGFRCEYIERDAFDLITITRYGGNFQIRIDWISPTAGSNFTGYTQMFDVPEKSIKLILLGWIKSEKILCNTSRRPTRVINHADRTIQKIRENKYKRRALCKALRDNFNYNGDTVHLYSDGESFYFEDYSGDNRMMNGGLILHQYNARNRAGDHFPAFRYSVHT